MIGNLSSKVDSLAEKEAIVLNRDTDNFGRENILPSAWFEEVEIVTRPEGHYSTIIFLYTLRL